MSRNVRRKFQTRVKPPRRRGSDTSSSLDLSDDDGYSAVEDISDSEDNDEEDVNAVEEKNIMTEKFGGSQTGPSPRPVIEEEDDEDEDSDDQAVDDDAFDDDESSSGWAGIASGVESHHSDFYEEATAFTSDNNERHVRFNVPSSESDSTESEDDHAEMFPDIFVAQNSLDPAFRREIEHDPDDSSGSGTFWDFHGHYTEQADHFTSEAEDIDAAAQVSEDETPIATPAIATAASTPVPAFEEPQELDGYETDGDTTEEDIPEPPIRRKTRRPSLPMSEISDSEADLPIKGQRGQPRVGRFNLDKSDKKPIAVLNPLTRKMMIFTPHRRRQLDLSPEQFNIPWHMEDTASPILSNSANMMLSAMFSSNTFGDFINTQAMGPTEAFFPFQSEAPDDSSSLRSAEEEDDEAEQKLDINDFITWDDGGSSGDEAEPAWEPSSTPMRPSTAGSDVDVLGHLNSETVGAFRRNQINQQLILSNQATQDSLAFSGPYNYTALKGIKSDRFDTAAAPLTPVRRHKKQMSDLTRSPLEAVSAKRKASAEASSNHKRHRSISDVNYLQI